MRNFQETRQYLNRFLTDVFQRTDQGEKAILGIGTSEFKVKEKRAEPVSAEVERGGKT